MKRRIVLAFITLAAPLGGCVERAPLRNDLAGYAPQELKAAAQRAETPAGISTVAFKELGDSRRFALAERLIRQTWDESCKPASLQLRTYSPNGASQWDVHCKNTMIAKDYVLAIPERAADNARVLKCYAAGPRVTSCSIVGPGATAPARTAEAS